MSETKQTHIRIAVGGLNWTMIGSQLMLGFSGGRPSADEFQEEGKWLQEARADVVNPWDKRVSMAALRMLERGEAEVAMTTPPANAYMARHALGRYFESHDISAIARLPHEDWVGFVVRADTGIKSLEEIREVQPELHLVRRPREYTDPPKKSITGFIVDEVMKQYGLSDSRIEQWGGSITYNGRHLGPEIADREFNALFDEAMMTPQWRELAESTDLRFLPVGEDVIELLTDMYGLQRGEIPKGFLPGIESSVPTISMSGWLLTIRDDLDDQVAYRITEALDNKAETISSFFEGMDTDRGYTKPPLTSPIDMNEVWKGTQIPLHDGAEQYYEEHGYK